MLIFHKWKGAASYNRNNPLPMGMGVAPSSFFPCKLLRFSLSICGMDQGEDENNFATVFLGLKVRLCNPPCFILSSSWGNAPMGTFASGCDAMHRDIPFPRTTEFHSTESEGPEFPPFWCPDKDLCCCISGGRKSTRHIMKDKGVKLWRALLLLCFRELSVCMHMAPQPRLPAPVFGR